MFDVKLYNFSKKENSTKRPSSTPTVVRSCHTNAPLDTLAPVVPLNLGAPYNPATHNYMHIPSMSRYYWIQRWTWDRGLWHAHCEVDVLASWKDEILSNTCYVLRSSQDYDLSIQDTTYPAKASITQTVDSYQTPWDAEGEYVVGFVSSGGLTQYAVLTPAEFVTFGQTVFSDTFANNTIGTELGTDLVKSIIDPMQYIVSVMWIPRISGGGGRAREIKLGWWSTGVQGTAISNDARLVLNKTFNIPKHPQSETRGSYLNMAPYAEYVLDVRPWGRIVLDPAYLKDDGVLNVVYVVDLISGSGTLWAATDESRICLSVAQVGVPVQISQVLHNYAGMITGAVGAIANAAAGNALGAAAGVGNMISNAFPTASVQGVNGGRSSLFGNWQLTAKFYEIVSEDIDHRGRPLCQNRRLSTLSGFVQVADADISLSCTADEARSIRAYMEGGFFIE